MVASFYMPHGITVDKEGNVWLTDVALHQVFKFTPQSKSRPALVLGEKFVPRDDDNHFCKPSAVAVLSTGDFFVADGYCNSRIVKFAPDGTKILQWGKGEQDWSLKTHQRPSDRHTGLHQYCLAAEINKCASALQKCCLAAEINKCACNYTGTNALEAKTLHCDHAA
ncbi:jg13580 [Pararge aegeria aegeria]|uniref:peptidylamidoglycolate lyase n=1 Tax=Pararge aegeria aegeria TaxID=348720 RepID=A0A8S4QTD7_9NEOP|nr:jg13580 [Pararge aegeria aegeria]